MWASANSQDQNALPVIEGHSTMLHKQTKFKFSLSLSVSLPLPCNRYTERDRLSSVCTSPLSEWQVCPQWVPLIPGRTESFPYLNFGSALPVSQYWREMHSARGHVDDLFSASQIRIVHACPSPRGNFPSLWNHSVWSIQSFSWCQGQCHPVTQHLLMSKRLLKCRPPRTYCPASAINSNSFHFNRKVESMSPRHSWVNIRGLVRSHITSS
jgi:hypothetical protein